MRVGVAVAVEVAALVDGHAADGELDVLPFARVEAAQEDLLGVAFAALVGEQDARRELQELGRVLCAARARARRPSDVEVGGAAARRRERPVTCTSSAAPAARERRGCAGGGTARRSGRRRAAAAARAPPWAALHELGRRRRRREVERHLDAARDGLAVAHRRGRTSTGARRRSRPRRGRRRRTRATSTFETWPSASTVTASTTSACLRSASADGGYTASTCVSTTGGVTAGGACASVCARAAGAIETIAASTRERRSIFRLGSRGSQPAEPAFSVAPGSAGRSRVSSLRGSADRSCDRSDSRASTRACEAR